MTPLESIERQHLALRDDMRPQPYALLLDERAVMVVGAALSAAGMRRDDDAWVRSGGEILGLRVQRVPDSGGVPVVVDARGRRA
jgi:hypothetical protein